MRCAASASSGSSSSSLPGSATSATLPPRSIDSGTRFGRFLFRWAGSARRVLLGRILLGGGELTEAGAAHRRQQLLAARPLVVPRERDLTHEVRVGGLEAVVLLQRAGEPADAPLAADAGDRQRLGLRRHRRQATVRATRSA